MSPCWRLPGVIVHIMLHIIDLERVRWGCTVPCLWVPLGCKLCLHHLISQRVRLMGYVLSMFYQWYCIWLLQLVEHSNHHWPYMVTGWGDLIHPRYWMLLLHIIDGTGCILVPDWRWLHCHLLLVVQPWWTPVYSYSTRGWYNLLLLILFCDSSAGIDPSVVEYE